MRLIDAERLKELVSSFVGYWEDDGFCVELLAVIRAIDNAPTIEAEPVKRGAWEHLDNDWFDLWRCTVCGEEWTFEYDPTDADTKVNYCPNCGAKMDTSI